VAPPAEDYIRNQKMTRFIFRSVVTASPVDSGGRGGGETRLAGTTREAAGVRGAVEDEGAAAVRAAWQAPR